MCPNQAARLQYVHRFRAVETAGVDKVQLVLHQNRRRDLRKRRIDPTPQLILRQACSVAGKSRCPRAGAAHVPHLSEMPSAEAPQQGCLSSSGTPTSTRRPSVSRVSGAAAAGQRGSTPVDIPPGKCPRLSDRLWQQPSPASTPPLSLQLLARNELQLSNLLLFRKVHMLATTVGTFLKSSKKDTA